MTEGKLRTMQEVLGTLTKSAVALSTSGTALPEGMTQAMSDTVRDIRDLAVKIRDEPEPRSDEMSPDGVAIHKLSSKKDMVGESRGR